MGASYSFCTNKRDIHLSGIFIFLKGFFDSSVGESKCIIKSFTFEMALHVTTDNTRFIESFQFCKKELKIDKH